MYRPCKSNGPLSTYQQHLRALGHMKRNECPKNAILHDLGKEISKWQADGKTIILVADFNEDVQSAELTQFFWQFDLIEVLTKLNQGRPPATHNRGSRPIDGVFIPIPLLRHACGGYLKFGEGILRDHRAIWLDLLVDLVCHRQAALPVWAPAHQLQCKDPRIVQKYNEILRSRLQLNNILACLTQLETQALSGRLSHSQQAEYERIDNIMVEAKLLAESKCRKIKAGNIPWCPHITRGSINKILYWKGIQKKIAGGHIGTAVLTTCAKKAGIQHDLNNIWLSPETIKTHLVKAQSTFTCLKKDTKCHDTWLAGLINAQAEVSGRSKKSLWKQLRATKNAHNTAHAIKAALTNLNRTTSLSIVIGPDAQSGHQTYSNKGKLEQVCLDEAGRCFTQAHDTPFLMSPLLHLFGETGKGAASFNQVLAGEFTPPMACDPYAMKLLHYLYRPSSIQDIPPQTTAEYQQGWRQAHESTTSSPSGIHFGHYIAGTFNPEILLISVKLADIPLQTGFSPARWKKGLNVMLEKVAGNVNVEKLHIILLFEADFNYNNKWLGRAIMFNVESAGMIAEEQYGSQKHKSAIIQCLNKTLFYDWVRFPWQPAGLCSNDVKSCYNRIILLVAALCLCHLGTNQKSVFSMILTLQQMNHHIRTTYSDSAKSGN